jgi:hypothetical protein
VDIAADLVTIRLPDFSGKETAMSETHTDPSHQNPQQQVRVTLDERDLKTIFANAYRIHTTAEEVVVDFGFNMPDPNPQQQQPQLLFKVTDRVIMSYSSIKRLSTSLSQLIKRYEQQFGEIPTQPGPRKA